MARPVDPIRVAAENLVRVLCEDPQFVAHVAEEEVRRRVEAGELIPASRLQLAPGLELAPAGRVAQLEGALRALVASSRDSAAFAAAVALAEDLLPRDDDVVDAEPEPADEPVGDPPEEDAPEPDPVVEEPAGPPPGMPAADFDGPCEDCGNPVENPSQAQASYVMFDRPLCRECHKTLARRDKE